MNDFTKDELKKILWHITTKTSIEPGNELVPKIQDMIENYCEHEIKISKRKCPICNSDFNEPYLRHSTQELITDCSNLNCAYFHGIKVL